jgi:hypothetical protein
MINFERFEKKFEEEGLECVEENAGYLTFTFKDGSVFEVLGLPNEQHPGYTDVQIKEI